MCFNIIYATIPKFLYAWIEFPLPLNTKRSDDCAVIALKKVLKNGKEITILQQQTRIRLIYHSIM